MKKVSVHAILEGKRRGWCCMQNKRVQRY